MEPVISVISVRTSNICKSKPVSTNVSNSTPSIGSCSVSKSKPVHSCPIRTNEPVVSGNFRPCKRVRTSNACKHKSRNHSSKYKRNYLSLFLFFSAEILTRNYTKHTAILFIRTIRIFYSPIILTFLTLFFHLTRFIFLKFL